MLSDFGIEESFSKSFQSSQRAFLIDPQQTTRTDDIRRHNSRKSPVYVLAAQDAHPRAREN
jgi:hypothetical protein